MSELTLFLLRIGFLALLWAFVFIVIFALRSDLFGQKVRKLPQRSAAGFPAATPSPSPSPSPSPPRGSAPSKPNGPLATRLVITAGAKEGLEVPLPADLLTIGRSSDSGLVIRDDYTSTHHARLLLGDRGWMIDDLDSTNGTTLDGKRVTTPTPVPLNTPVTIGTTTFELRR